MSRLPVVFIVSGLAACVLAGAPPRDTIPPEGRWTSPVEFSVIRSNQVRLAVEAHDDSGGSGLARAVFFASYTNSRGQRVEKESLGEADRFPLELYWDCAGLPDQHFRNILLICDLYDRAGNRQELQYGRFVLDRNLNFQEQGITAGWARRPPSIDGDLGDWPATPAGVPYGGQAGDSLYFPNNDNRVTVRCQWDRQCLYFGIRVLDRSVISHYTAADTSVEGSWNEDDVEIFLDPHRERGEIMNRRQRQYDFTAGGMAYLLIRDTAEHTVNMHPDLRHAVKVRGTLNREDDVDTGWTLECAIPWSAVGIAPRPGVCLGWDVGHSDKDFLNGSTFAINNFGKFANNLINPSEWGRLTLVKPGPRPWVLAVAAVILLGGLGGFLRWRKRSRENIGSPPAPAEMKTKNEQVQKALDYIAAHYTEENLDLNAVASHVCLNPAYFSTLFSREAGTSFVKYLSNFRIKKAEEILKETGENITQVAYKVGFGSIGNFNRAFKQINKTSPKIFRKTPES